jgi:chemotaxis protein MotB
MGAEKYDETVQVLEVDGNLVVRLMDDAILFEPGSAALTGRHKELLRHVASMVRVLPYSTRVEGHTDSIPINTAEFPSNWELSTRRATNVVMHMIRELGISPDKLSAAGYAETRPVAPNNTAANRQKNRRIDIVVCTQQAPACAVVRDAMAGSTQADSNGSMQPIVSPVDIRGGH